MMRRPRFSWTLIYGKGPLPRIVAAMSEDPKKLEVKAVATEAGSRPTGVTPAMT